MITFVKNRKKALLLGVLIILILATAGVSIAFLIDTTDDVNNKFTPSQVTCKVEETLKDNVKSDVKILSTSDVDAFIRATVVITLRDKDGNIAPLAASEQHYTVEYGADWYKGNDNYYYYKTAIHPGKCTENLINSIEPTSNIPGEYVLSVEIIADAIQAEGVSSSDETGDAGKAPAEIAWSNDKVTVTVDGDKLSIINK